MQTLKKNDLNIKSYTLKLKSIVDYLAIIGKKVKSCVRKLNLATIGEKVKPRDLILYGLGGLDSDYNSFISDMYLLMRSDKV